MVMRQRALLTGTLVSVLCRVAPAVGGKAATAQQHPSARFELLPANSFALLEAKLAARLYKTRFTAVAMLSLGSLVGAAWGARFYSRHGERMKFHLRRLRTNIKDYLQRKGFLREKATTTEGGGGAAAGQGQGEGDTGPTCCICLSTPPQSVFLPCGHICCCEACATEVLSRFHRCPMCRIPVQTANRLYWSG